MPDAAALVAAAVSEVCSNDCRKLVNSQIKGRQTIQILMYTYM